MTRFRPLPTVALAASLLAGAGCSTDPSQPYLFGLGDPVRAGALSAPWDFGRTGQLAGQPAAAALAAFRVEQLTRAAEVEPLWQVDVDPLLQPRLRMARAQMREALGVAPSVAPEVAMGAFYAAFTALRRDDRVAAVAALTVPGFTLGGEGTLARLDDLPRLRLVDEAAQAVAQEASHPSWTSRGRRR